MTLTILIPTYNDAVFLERILNKLIPLCFKEVIVINDHSNDLPLNTQNTLIKQYKWLKIINRNNGIRGKGASIIEGLKEVKTDFVVIQDADLEYNPSDISKMISLASEKNIDVVYGSRFKNKKVPQGMQFKNFCANKLLTLASNLLFDHNITDEATAYKMIKTSTLRSLNLESKGFELCPEITAKLGMLKIPIHEVPVEYVARTVKEGKKIRWTDGVIALYTLLKIRYGLNRFGIKVNRQKIRTILPTMNRV